METSSESLLNKVKTHEKEMTFDLNNEIIQREHSGSLNDKWNLYYHLPNDKKWDLNSYKIIMKEIDNNDKLVSLNNNFTEKIVKNCMLFIMKDEITPMWEDPRNRNGGCFSFKVINKFVNNVWKSVFYALCGGTLFINREYHHLINGITISPKKNFCILKIWLEDCSIQDVSLIDNIPNLYKPGALFKSHSPEF